MPKLTYDYVKEYVENNNGYKLLSKEYIGNKTKLEIQCDKNHIFYMTWSDFRQGKRCKQCANKKLSEIKKHDIQHIKNIIENYGYTLDRKSVV